MKNANATKQGVSVGACFKAAEGDDAAYGDVRDRFLALGGKASEWRTRVAQEAMLSALTYAEDRLEPAAGGQSGAGVNAGGAAATGVRALAVRGSIRSGFAVA